MEFKVNVPNNLSEITLAQYMKYENLVNVNKDDVNSESFISLKMLEIFCNVPYDQAIALKIKDVTHIVNIISDAINSKPELVERFSMGGVEFGFIPKIEDMSLDVWVGT